MALHARGGAGRPAWWIGGLHGVGGAIGTAWLLLAVRGGIGAGRPGTAQFGVDALVLFAAALASGLMPVVARLQCRPIPMLALGLHATFAIMGLVVLAALL